MGEKRKGTKTKRRERTREPELTLLDIKPMQIDRSSRGIGVVLVVDPVSSLFTQIETEIQNNASEERTRMEVGRERVGRNSDSPPDQSEPSSSDDFSPPHSTDELLLHLRESRLVWISRSS